MSSIILHHYPISPFSEKVRAILGYKQLVWQSAHIPPVMPKPDLIALTGGYRKTPVLQIGSDIYCDSKLIVRVLERLQSQPALIPKGLEATLLAEDLWSEQYFFFLAIPIAMQTQGMAHLFDKMPSATIEHFQKDRAGLFGSGNARKPSMAVSRAEFPSALSSLDTQLNATHFLHGENPTLADFSIYHSIWFILSNPGVADYLAPYKNILSWAHRIAAFGHGTFERLSSEDAIAIARNTPALPFEDEDLSSSSGARIGDEVTVNATDYGTDEISGALLHLTAHEIVLRRHDARAGEVTVHFPRTGFRLNAAKH